MSGARSLSHTQRQLDPGRPTKAYRSFGDRRQMNPHAGWNRAGGQSYKMVAGPANPAG